MQFSHFFAGLIAVVLVSDMAHLVHARNQEWDERCTALKKNCKTQKKADLDHAYYDCMCHFWTGRVIGSHWQNCKDGCVDDLTSGSGAMDKSKATDLCNNYCYNIPNCDPVGVEGTCYSEI